MKNRTLWLVAAAALVCGLGLGSSAQTKPPEQKGWEYQTYYGAPTQLPSLNPYGAAGWELAGVACEDNL
jgi:hypothetical protein